MENLKYDSKKKFLYMIIRSNYFFGKLGKNNENMNTNKYFIFQFYCFLKFSQFWFG